MTQFRTRKNSFGENFTRPEVINLFLSFSGVDKHVEKKFCWMFQLFFQVLDKEFILKVLFNKITSNLVANFPSAKKILKLNFFSNCK